MLREQPNCLANSRILTPRRAITLISRVNIFGGQKATIIAQVDQIYSGGVGPYYIRDDRVDPFTPDEQAARKAITRAAKGVAERPETKSSRREVKLLVPATQAINNQKSHTWLDADPHGSFFRNPGTGERWSSSQAIQKIWVTALKRAGVRYWRP